MRVLYRNRSEQHDLIVYDTKKLYGDHGRFRVLEFSGEAVQGAMDLEQPTRMVLEYPRAMVHLMERNNPDFETAFIIGHGIGTLSAYLADRRLKVAELDTEVVDISREFFGYDANDVIVGDGRELLEQEPSEMYDVIVVDAFTAAGTPAQFVSSSFFRLVKDRLRPDGLLLMNIFGRSGNDSQVNAICATLSEHFAHTRLFALPTESGDEIQNRILAGCDTTIHFQVRQMAGFVEQQPGEGHVIENETNGA